MSLNAGRIREVLAGVFELPPFGAGTRARLAGVFEKARIQDIVDGHNPVDLTPMCNDEAYEEAVRAVLEDGTVDAVIDGGPVFDPLARHLEEEGVPVFRAADRALRLFATYCEARLRDGGRRLKGR